MRLEDFQYALPPELIATRPADRREHSRLMVLPGSESHEPPFPIEHRQFSDLVDYLRPGDCLVLNDSRVIPARLRARRATGGAVELMLLGPSAEGDWEAMARPARKVQAGDTLVLPAGGRVRVIACGEGGHRTLRFDLSASEHGDDLMAYLDAAGEIPLPPYIVQQRRERGEAALTEDDRERYQTVYAAAAGSVAAPTAGLHFTPELLDALRRKGVEIQTVTLHVGAGTFEPIHAERIEEHRMHHEWIEIAPEAAAAIEAARSAPERRVVAVGTTSVRTLESCFARHGCVRAIRESTDIFIYPGYRFGVVDALVTNFHLPDSTLMLLVAALAGRERILAAYAAAVTERYRFFSYGDAMLIER